MPTELFIGKLLRIGLALSIIIVLFGGVLFLIEYGNSIATYQTFNPTGLHPSSSVHHSFKYFSAGAVIQIGLLILVYTQVLRVALTVLLFQQQKDYIFTCISLFILAVLTYSVFFHSQWQYINQ